METVAGGGHFLLLDQPLELEKLIVHFSGTERGRQSR